MERELLPPPRMGVVGRLAITAAIGLMLFGSAADATARLRRRRRPPPPPREQTNVHFAPLRTIALPGRGLALAWAPDGEALAVGGHFRDPTTRLRYDTRIADAATGTLVRSFACHYFWVIATAWVDNPYLGEVIADGGGDHAVKVWDARGPGSTRCNPGQLLAADGGLAMLPRINGWITSLAFSPDGRHLAGASRDRTIRIWQVAPGKHQWQVVGLWYDEDAGNFLSVAWAPDGRALATGDRRGRVAVWPFDPEVDRWDDETIGRFARVWFEAQPDWFHVNAALVTRTPRWSETGHRVVWNVRYAPDGTRVAAAGADGVLSVYDAGSGAVLFRTGAPRATALHGLDWSPDGSWLAAGAADHHVYVLDAANGARHDTLATHADVVAAVAWSPDGRTLASTAGGPRLGYELTYAVEGPDQTVQLWAWR